MLSKQNMLPRTRAQVCASCISPLWGLLSARPRYEQHNIGHQSYPRTPAVVSSTCLAAAGQTVAMSWFAIPRPYKGLSFKHWRVKKQAGNMNVQIDVLLDGRLETDTSAELEHIAQQLRQDAEDAVRAAMNRYLEVNPKYKLPGCAMVSLVLCDDPHIQTLNLQYRNKDAPTDVLSFEIADDPDFPVTLPIKLLGDLVISLDTALRQAEERSAPLRDELRVLLVHGVLHLLGYDHEKSEQQLRVMAAEEEWLLSHLGWSGSGLISAAHEGQLPGAGRESQELVRASSGSGSGSSSSGGGAGSEGAADKPPSSSSSTSTSAPSTSSPRTSPSSPSSSFRSSDVRMVALDMDGTLLDSSSRIRPATAAAIREACRRGVLVCLATGKARPAALKACDLAGLMGEGLLASLHSPGIFLQGLVVHGRGGVPLSSHYLPPRVVEDAFSWGLKADITTCGFLGDECVTLQMTPYIRELHDRYYEPLSQVFPSVPALMSGPPVRKVLFMSTPERIAAEVMPHWRAAVEGSGAGVMQAVSSMLELVPEGVDKWQGMTRLMSHLGLEAGQLMAVGDGGNDLTMVAGAGIGVAMGNAVPQVKRAASLVVASNDEDGVAEALERFVL